MTLFVFLFLMGAGVIMLIRPASFAKWEAEQFRSKLGIKVGLVGKGTQIYYRLLGLGFVLFGLLFIWESNP